MSVECAEVSFQPHSEMHQKNSEFPTLDSRSALKLKRTGDLKFVDSCSDTIRIYAAKLYLLNSRIGCCTTVDHFTILLRLSIWDLIAR